MREIKFRVWDNELKKWIWDLGMKPNNVLVDGKEKGRFSVLQYTGLKDKNGKEIYEGDVVKNTTRRQVFGLFDNEYKYKEEITETVDVIEWQKSWASFSFTKRCEWGVFEIIGNVFENPDHVQFNIKS